MRKSIDQLTQILTNMKKKKAKIYQRTATRKLPDSNSSIEQQKELIKKYCAGHSIEVIGFYREDHSAKTFVRPQFKKILDFLKHNKGAADMLLFLRWDRFSRNAPEAYTMISRLHKLGVEPQATEQPLNFDIPEH